MFKNGDFYKAILKRYRKFEGSLIIVYSEDRCMLKGSVEKYVLKENQRPLEYKMQMIILL